MIDNQMQVEKLLVDLSEAVPLLATASPVLMATLIARPDAAEISADCTVINVSYAGDEGGIMCQVRFGESENQAAVFVSITHLSFGRRFPNARMISAYQKHRIKRIRQQNAAAAPSRRSVEPRRERA